MSDEKENPTPADAVNEEVAVVNPDNPGIIPFCEKRGLGFTVYEENELSEFARNLGMKYSIKIYDHKQKDRVAWGTGKTQSDACTSAMIAWVRNYELPEDNPSPPATVDEEVAVVNPDNPENPVEWNRENILWRVRELYQEWLEAGGKPKPLKGRDHILRITVDNRRGERDLLIEAGVAHEEIYDRYSSGHVSSHIYFPADFIDAIDDAEIPLARPYTLSTLKKHERDHQIAALKEIEKLRYFARMKTKGKPGRITKKQQAREMLDKAKISYEENPCAPTDKPQPSNLNPEFKPPGKWTPEGTRAFYEKHNGSVTDMAATIKKWTGVGDPYAFAAQVKDYCEGTTAWRKRSEDNSPDPGPEQEPAPPPKVNPALAEIAVINPEVAVDFPPAREIKNPKKWTQKDLAVASEIYENFLGEEPESIDYIVIKGRTVLIKLAKADSITYEAAKHGAESMRYNHRFEGEAWVYWDMANRGLVIMGKDIEITEAGIEG